MEREFKKTFKYEACRRCENTFGKSACCRKCNENHSQFSELYHADENCVHEIIVGNGVRCKKCGGWFCY